MIRNILILTRLSLTAILFILHTYAYTQSIQTLKDNFKNPPSAAWPRTWWHWTNSNITKEGITKDLEWMKRVGIKGFQLGDVAYGNGQTVDNKIIFGSPAWLDAVKHTATEADRLDLEMAMFTSAGWSLTGGPWVKPEQAMKKLVWSETRVEGSKTLKVKLQQPPSIEGAGPNLMPLSGNVTGGKFYSDFSVIAYRTPSDELVNASDPKVTTGAGPIDSKLLFDNDVTTAVTIQSTGEPKKAWIQLDFSQPLKTRSITIAGRRGIPFGRVMASNDSVSFYTLAAIPGKSGYRGGNIRTYDFPETNARYYRIEMTNAPARPADVISQATTIVDTAYQISEIKLHTGGRVNRWEDKAGFNFLFEYAGTETPGMPASALIPSSGIIDLTSKMSADGTLTWDAPAGNWTIMRFGYALTGAKNRPAVPSGLGYEVDKLSKKYVEEYLKGYTEPLKSALGDLYGKRLQYMLMDSWEAGIQNWTDDMPAEFKKRRGYDLTPFLPVLAGRVVQSPDVSDRFLWDFRRTLVDMFAENHYGTVTNFLNRQGIKTYSEAGGVSLETIEDALLYKKYVDIPMGEFWVKDLHPSSMYYEDVRGAASSSHVYGKGLVAAEAFTGGNYESPYTLKKIADYWFTQGVNQLVFHTSAHQPLDTKPGNAMVGTHIHRNITWAEMAKPFMTYVARNSYMLQQGKYVADVAYLLNEGAPSTMPFWGAGLQPALPEGYSFDYINADVLLNRITLAPGGRITLPDGLSYALLVLPETELMTLPMLRKIRNLVKGGATVLGSKPLKSPGLTAYPESDREINELANEVWGDLDGNSRTMRTFGKGRVMWGMPVKTVLSSLCIMKDVEVNRPAEDVSWIHRKYGDDDVYYIVNRTDTMEDLQVKFRAIGRAELWHSDDGEITPTGYTTSGEQTTVPLHLEERESIFVVFDNNTKTASYVPAAKRYNPIATLSGPWTIRFPAGWGAPGQIQMQQLQSWTTNADSGVKYFSGTATYSKELNTNKSWFKTGEKIFLDLGDVKDIAVVSLNGKIIDTLWKAPFRCDVTGILKPGKNVLEIRVTNEWTNRLIGDQLSPGKKILTSYIQPFGGKYELTPSGLLGPVRVVVGR